MKSLPSRSPSRRCSPPPPPRLSRRSPGFSRRGRSPDRRRRGERSGSGGRMSPPRNRERREFRPSPRRRSRSPVHESSQPPDFPVFRRSRSPVRESKMRSFSPKRKTPAKRERRDAERERPSQTMGHKHTRSKSPPIAAGPSIREVPRLAPYNSPPEELQSGRSYQGPDAYPSVEPTVGVDHGRMSSLGERFQGSGRGSYEEDHGDRPVFRGPEGTGYDIKELKKITVDIHLPVKKARVERTVINPEELLVVRQDGPSYDINTLKKMTIEIPGLPLSKPRNVERTVFNPEDVVVVRRPGEGSRPIFAREEIIQGNRFEPEPSPFDHRPVSTDDHQRVVAIPSQTQSSGGPRIESPGRYVPSHSSTPYIRSERESHPRDYAHPRDYERSRGPSSSFDSRDKNRDDHFERRDDLRHDLEIRRRDDSRYSSHGDGLRYDKGRDYREGDRHDRESGRRHPVDRHEGERDHDRRPMMSHTASPGDRTRGDGFGHMDDSDRKIRDGRMPGPSYRRNEQSDTFFQDGKMRPRPGPYQKSWDMNPEYVPKGRSYFEHDNRDDIRIPIRGRGIMGPRGYMRGRGMMRGRPFRGSGPSRGFMGGRATGRRGGFSQRFKPRLPKWEHDLFDSTSTKRDESGHEELTNQSNTK